MTEEEKEAVKYTENCLMKITMGIDCEFDVNILDALINIIKKLQKENEELNYKLHSKKIALEIYNRYIPKSKLKEKKEELDKEEKRELKGTKGQDRYYIKQKYMYKRKVLQELLEESEE